MSANNLLDTVVTGGYCIGCGACASVEDTGIEIGFTHKGTYCAVASGHVSNAPKDPERWCPFSDLSVDESELGASLFPSAKENERIGRFISTYAGWVEEGQYRARGSSGGLATWIAAKMLESKMVDGVAHVTPRHPTPSDGRLFTYAISRDIDSIHARSKTRYYPVEMSEVLREIASTPGRYLVIGLPCFIKAIRLLQRDNEIYSKRIAYTIGLVCGHSKSSGFAETLAWQMGVHPNNLATIDFRVKLNGKPANKYGVTVTSKGRKMPRIKPINKLFGCDWGAGLFKYKACEYCDDVLAETADVSIGDAWLPEYISDSRGANILVARSDWAEKLVTDGMARGELATKIVPPELIIQSQASGLRHRREGLAYRIQQAESANIWVPRKRFTENKRALTPDEQRKYQLRSLLSDVSQQAFEKAKKSNNLDILYTALSPYLTEYSLLITGQSEIKLGKKRPESFWRRLLYYIGIQ